MNKGIRASAADTAQRQPASLWAQASATRKRAREILDGHSGKSSHRMTLVLSSVVIFTVFVALYMAAAGLATAGYLTFGDQLWIDAASDIFLVLLCLVLVLPLIASMWRLACLMTAPDGDVTAGIPVSVPMATLSELFYPFTSLRAYGRTMAVAMEGLAFAMLSVGFPVLGFRAALLSISSWVETSRFLFALLTVAAFLLCCSLCLLFFFLSGRRAGFGYFVFVHEDMSLSDVNRYFRGFRRSLSSVFCLRVSLAGWMAVSLAGIFVPFVVHVLPYGLCCMAAYSRSLQRIS